MTPWRNKCVVRARHDNVCGHLSFKCHSRSCSTQWRTHCAQRSAVSQHITWINVDLSSYPVTFIWGRVHWRYLSHLSIKWTWKLLIWNFIQICHGQWVNFLSSAWWNSPWVEIGQDWPTQKLWQPSTGRTSANFGNIQITTSRRLTFLMDLAKANVFTR